MPTWMNAGRAQYHGLTVSLRRAYSNGLSFDFNYTWSHSIDYASAAESGSGKQGAAIQNIFNVKEFRGSSDFDIRQAPDTFPYDRDDRGLRLLDRTSGFKAVRLKR